MVGRLLSLIAIHPEGVRSHLPLELLIRSGKTEDEMQMSESQRWLVMLCMLFSFRLTRCITFYCYGAKAFVNKFLTINSLFLL